MIINCVAYDKGKKFSKIELSQVSEHLNKDLFIWVALKDATAEELAQLQNEFDLPELAIEDTQQGHQRPKIEEYDDLIFTVVHVPEIVGDRLVTGELHIFLSTKYIISVRSNTNQSFHNIRVRLESNVENFTIGPGLVFYSIIDAVVDRYFPLVYSFEDDLDSIEQHIFNKEASRQIVKRIYALKSKASHLKYVVTPLHEGIKRLNEHTPAVLEGTEDLFRDITDHLLRLTISIETIIVRADSVMQANISLIAIEDSAINKKLAAWAAIFAVSTALAGVWGMNFKFMPELDWKYGYFVAIGIIVIIGGYLYYRFKKSGWL